MLPIRTKSREDAATSVGDPGTIDNKNFETPGDVEPSFTCGLRTEARTVVAPECALGRKARSEREPDPLKPIPAPQVLGKSARTFHAQILLYNAKLSARLRILL